MPSTATSSRHQAALHSATQHVPPRTPEASPSASSSSTAPAAGPPPQLSPSHPRPSIVASAASPSSLFVRTVPRTRSQRSQSRLSSVTASQSSHTASESSRPPSPTPIATRQSNKRARRGGDAEDSADISSGSASSSVSAASASSSSAVQIAATMSSRSQASTSSPTSRQSQHEPIVISSSDESDQDDPPRRVRRLATRRVRRNLTAATHAIDPDDSQTGFSIERVVHPPAPVFANQTEPITVGDDSIVGLDIGGSGSTASDSNTESEDDVSGILAPAAAAPAATAKTQPPTLANGLRPPVASPPRAKPPAITHPLLSKYTCPVCLCTPFPNVVATPCGHVFCSECLFESIHAPIKQKHMEIRSQLAAFAQYPSLASTSHAGLAAAEFAQWNVGHIPPLTTQQIAARTGVTRGGHALAAAAAARANASAASGSAPTPATNQAQPQAVNSTPAAATLAPAPAPAAAAPRGRKVPDPMVGKCPVCRTDIPGGFIGGHMSVKKRAVFGLELKLGKPIDDPRKQGAA